jgi:hypothetical protein
VNWFWIIVGAVAIFAIWRTRAKSAAEAEKRIDSYMGKVESLDRALAGEVRDAKFRNVAAVVGTIVAVLFFGYIGIWSPMQENQRQSAIEDEWFATYDERHQSAWYQACESFFSLSDNGIMYRNGEPRDAAWCRGEWRPPVVPSEYSTSEYDAPDSVPPFASQLVFGMNLNDVSFCVSPYDVSSCFAYDEIRGTGP